MNQNRHNLNGPSKIVILMEYFYIILGSLVIAATFNLFLNPNGIAPGGVSGLSTIFEHRFGIEAALTQWALNIPLFIAGLILLGKKFGSKTALGTVVLPFFVYMTRDLPPMTNQLLLASIYGGVGIGIGLGLVFRSKASTGGTDLAAQILHKYTGISLGVAVLLMDGLVVFISGVVFGPENAMFALISLYITSKTIDLVQLGLGYSKMAFIISDKQELIAKAIINDLKRGVTIINGTGGFTGHERQVIIAVFQQRETTKLKELIKRIDSLAFIIVSDANEVLGQGFKTH